MRNSPVLLLVYFTVVLALGACTGPPPGYTGPPPGQALEGQEPCDPIPGCDEFCGNAGCLFPADPDGSICDRHCRANWCNVYFDDVDAEVMACSRTIGYDIVCDDTLVCCHDNFTNEICPSEAEGGWSGE